MVAVGRTPYLLPPGLRAPDILLLTSARAASNSCTRPPSGREVGPWSDVATHGGRMTSVVVARRGEVQDAAMVSQPHPEPENTAPAPPRNLLATYPVVRSFVAFWCFEAAYYFAYRYGMTFTQTTASPFWFPDSVLLCALLRVRPRWWPLLLAGTLPIRLFSEVAENISLAMLMATTINDHLKAVIGAILLHRFMDDPVRFHSVRDFGVFCLIAVLAIPGASAFAGAFTRDGFGPEYWMTWEQWFLGDALAHLIVTPFIFYWVFRAPENHNLTPAQWLEALILLLGLVVS